MSSPSGSKDSLEADERTGAIDAQSRRLEPPYEGSGSWTMQPYRCLPPSNAAMDEPQTGASL
jgi:hypothetical protein